MVKYYDLIGQKFVICLDWNNGLGSVEDAKKYFNCDVREISKKEFDELEEEYSKATN